MKISKLTLLSFIFLAGLIKANPVNISVAEKVAENFYASSHSAIIPNLVLAYTERDSSGQPVFYVFNIIGTTNTKGFVIVTADDAAHPIIGYSDEGSFISPNSNNNVSFWLQNRKNEVIAMRQHNIAATSDITNEWTSYISGSMHATHSIASNSVLPLCQSYWNQSPYYNAYCPGGSVTGCVATAMAQILKYWAYPSVGLNSNCYDEAPYGSLCATFDTSNYIWSAMQNTALGDSNNQVAKLMYDCGVSVNMDYSPTGSGAYVMGGYPSAEYSYINYFGYDASTINTAFYDSTQQGSWIALLENELNNNRPMQFQGFDPVNGGHSWVCDGYSALNMMHMNWGWGGYDNGYYYVNSLNPIPFDFTYNIGVLYGIEPPAEALGVKQIIDNAVINVYPNPGHGVFTFATPDNTAYKVCVYNALGQEINTSIISSPKSEINLSTQTKGVYIYKISTETGTLVSTGRLIVE